LSSSSPASSASTLLSLGMCDTTGHGLIICMSCFYLTLSLVSSMFCWIVIFLYGSVILVTIYHHHQPQLYSV
jgi:hypothetical protein